MTEHSQEPSQEPQVRTPEFTARVSDLLDLSEMAHNLASTSRMVEDKLIGYPDDDQNTPLVEPEEKTGVSVNADLKLYTDNIRASLQRISDSLGRLNSEA